MTSRPARKSGKPSKPMTAAQRRAADFERVGLQADAARLAANGDVQVERAERADTAAGKRGNVERARRLDAFEALREGMAVGAYDAARRLETDVLKRRGEHDGGRALERVDGGESATCATDVMLAAGRRVNQVMRMVGERDAWLLTELISPTTQATMAAAGWRGVVQYVTGETHSHAQGAVVRSACENLAYAYRRLETTPRARAA